MKSQRGSSRLSFRDNFFYYIRGFMPFMPSLDGLGFFSIRESLSAVSLSVIGAFFFFSFLCSFFWYVCFLYYCPKHDILCSSQDRRVYHD